MDWHGENLNQGDGQSRPEKMQRINRKEEERARMGGLSKSRESAWLLQRELSSQSLHGVGGWLRL